MNFGERSKCTSSLDSWYLASITLWLMFSLCSVMFGPCLQTVKRWRTLNTAVISGGETSLQWDQINGSLKECSDTFVHQIRIRWLCHQADFIEWSNMLCWQCPLVYFLSCPAYLLECVNGAGTDYRGTKSKTKTGKICQKWAAKYPHRPKYVFMHLHVKLHITSYPFLSFDQCFLHVSAAASRRRNIL